MDSYVSYIGLRAGSLKSNTMYSIEFQFEFKTRTRLSVNNPTPPPLPAYNLLTVASLHSHLVYSAFIAL